PPRRAGGRNPVPETQNGCAFIGDPVPEPPFRSVVRPGTSGEPRRWLRGNAVVTIPVTLAAPGEVGGKRGGTTSYEIQLGRGLLAATYLRGIPYVQVPTTLLAMIDSSIGGKTGVDVPAGKNLLGAFHQPCLVVADLDVLGSLPRPQLAAGMAEAVKHGVIADARYFETLETEHPAVAAQDPGALERVLRRSVELKAEV